MGKKEDLTAIIDETLNKNITENQKVILSSIKCQIPSVVENGRVPNWGKKYTRVLKDLEIDRVFLSKLTST